MTVSQKISVSLLISVVLFAGFAALAFTGLFELVETRFYNPAVAKGLSRDAEADAASAGEYLDELRDRFAAVLKEGAVKRSFLPNQGAEDIFERTKLFGNLMEALPGLQSVRFIDAAGKRIHYSTAKADALKQDRLSVLYRNYGENAGDLPFESVAAPDSVPFRLIVDAPRDRLVFSFPFHDSFEVYKGSALFSLSVRAVMERMIADGRIKVGEDLVPVADPPGFLWGLPKIGRVSLAAAAAKAWTDGARGLVPLARSSEGTSYALVSGKTRGGVFVGRLVGEDLFAFPPAMKAILLVSFFLTGYLIVFLFLNLRQDSMVVVRERVKRFQLSLLEEYYDRKEELDWDRWSRELDRRREEVRGELKRGLGRAVRKRNEADVDRLIDKSWDELIAALGSRAPQVVQATAQIDERKLQDILGRILSASPIVVAQAASAPVGTAPQAATGSAALPAGEVPEDEEVAEAEEVEEFEELTEAEELAAAEQLPETVELPEAVEAAVPEAATNAPSAAISEEPETVEAVEELEELEEVVELEEAEESPSVEVVSESVPFAELAAESAEAGVLEELEELDELVEAEIPESASTEAAGEEEIVPFEAPPRAEEAVEVPSSEESEEPADLEELPPPELERNYSNPNIRVVFDEDDDIPYIIETSGIELVDDDLNAVIGFIERGKPEELEELEPSELEEMEAAEAEPLSDTGEINIQAAPVMTAAKLDELAREIEFAPMKPSAVEDHSIPEFDISSPFDTLLGTVDFPDAIEELAVESESVDSSPDEAASLPDLVGPAATAAYRPFFAGPVPSSFRGAAESSTDELVTLESVEGDAVEEPAELLDADEKEDEYIVLKNGVAFVSDSAYEENSGHAVNPVLKDLAESVLGQQR